MKFNNETLRIAVKEWLKDETTAEAKYSHIYFSGYYFNFIRIYTILIEAKN